MYSSNETNILNEFKKTIENVQKISHPHIKTIVDDWITNSEFEIEIRIESLKIEIEKIAKKLEDDYKKHLKTSNTSLLHQCFRINDAKTRCNCEKLLFKSHKNRKKIKFYEKFKIDYVVNNNINTSIIGYFSYYFKYSTTSGINNLGLIFDGPFDYTANKHNLTIWNKLDETLVVVDTTCNFVKTHKIKYLANKPIVWMKSRSSLCINILNDIIMADADVIYVLNKDYECIKEIKYRSKITAMAVDDINPYLLYISTYSQQIHEFDILQDILRKKEKFHIATEINVDFGNIYLSNFLLKFNSHDLDLGSLRMFESTANSIFVLSKQSLLLLRKLEFSNWLSPQGLHVDNCGFIWTTAFKIGKNEKRSQYRYLFVINKNGVIIAEINLDSIQRCSGFTVIDNKLFIQWSKEIEIVELNSYSHTRYHSS